MQWTADTNAGFSTGTPWLPINENHTELNVAAAEADPHSLLHWYRRVIHLRKREPALHRGTYRPLPDMPTGVFGYMRTWAEDRIIVLLNFDRFAQTAPVPAQQGWCVLAGTDREPDSTLSGGLVELGGYEVVIAKANSAPKM